MSDLLTPRGRLAQAMDRTMLLGLWARELKMEWEQSGTGKSLIMAGIGRPTLRVHPSTVKAVMDYFETILQEQKAIEYGHPSGDLEARQKIAEALTKWYKTVKIEADNVLFTVGGVSALHSIFELINRKYPTGRIVTPFPHYPLYAGARGKNRLYPIDVMKEKGYRLTARGLANALASASRAAIRDGGTVSAFLLCDPNNPLGTAIDKNEVLQIAEVLRKYPHIFIVLDEAYAELQFHDEQTSLLTLAPDLKERIILIRSATKALSAAGERMAVVVAFNEDIMTELLQENIDICGHAPRSLQIAFAEAMSKLDKTELDYLKSHYHPRVDYVIHRLKNMKANMPDHAYRVGGAFYILADLSELLDLDLPPETQRALNKTGKIKTNEDIAYYLLFKEGVMIAPLSYFGMSPHTGYMRITCSAEENELKTLMDRIENQLTLARLKKNTMFKVYKQSNG